MNLKEQSVSVFSLWTWTAWADFDKNVATHQEAEDQEVKLELNFWHFAVELKWDQLNGPYWPDQEVEISKSKVFLLPLRFWRAETSQRFNCTLAKRPPVPWLEWRAGEECGNLSCATGPINTLRGCVCVCVRGGKMCVYLWMFPWKACVLGKA